MPETRLSKLDAAFRELSPEFAEFVPYLAWMMSIPRRPAPELEELEPEVVRNRIFDNLLKVLTLVASIRPSVLWIEDVQWADHSTQEFCRRSKRMAPIPGLIVVATMRTDYAQSDSTSAVVRQRARDGPHRQRSSSVRCRPRSRGR